LVALFSILVVFGAAFYFFFIQPEYERNVQLSNQHITLQSQYNEKKKIADNLEAYQQAFDILEKKLAKSLNELPKEKEIPSLLTNVANLAKDRGLEVSLFKPLPEVLKDFYAEVPVELKLFGTYHDTAIFFEAVANMDRIVNITNVDLKKINSASEDKSGGQDARLEIKCNAVTFRFVDRPVTPVVKK
jgi:type IV pilus assembly protein PilO